MNDEIKLQNRIERGSMAAVIRAAGMQSRVWPKIQEFAQEERLDKRSR